MSAWIIFVQITTLVLVIVGLVFVYWIFHKARKIHMATYRLLKDTEAIQKSIRTESVALFSQIQALATLEKKLDLKSALPPTRGWAGSPDFLLKVADIALSDKPGIVVECSSGVSTLVIARCLQLNGAGHVYSLEHDQSYAEKTSQMLNQYQLAEWATVLYAPLTRHSNDAPWYDDSVLSEDIGPIDMLVVDGPPQETAPLARLPALSRLLPRMAGSTVVILDDAAREAEQEIVKQWIQIAPEFKAEYLYYEKGCVVLRRTNAPVPTRP